MSRSLLGLLGEARERGFLGPGPVERQLAHAEELVTLLGAPRAPVLDLGAGAGLPGLVLAQRWPEATVDLLDANRRRAAFLTEAVEELDLASRVRVLEGRAEELARSEPARGRYELVTARAFGPPAVTAECAVGFLQAGGMLAVSEPGPGLADPEVDRWPEDGYRQLGLGGAELRSGSGATLAILRAGGPPLERWPRRVGVPAKRPLWGPDGPPRST